MEITINEKFGLTLERLATERSMTTEQYIAEYVDNHLLSQYKQELTDTINEQKLEDIDSIKDAVEIKVEEFNVRDTIVEEKIIETIKEEVIVGEIPIEEPII